MGRALPEAAGKSALLCSLPAGGMAARRASVRGVPQFDCDFGSAGLNATSSCHGSVLYPG